MPDASDQQELKWGDSFDLLSDKRKQELRERLLSWTPDMATKARPGPFAGERLNGLEVFWLAECAPQKGDDNAVVKALSLLGRFEVVRRVLPLAHVDLSHANLQRAHLTNAHLSHANLSHADLREANLQGADLWRALLVHANLAGCHLEDAHLTEADLTWAILIQAHLPRATLLRANLSEASLQAADLSQAVLFGADLSRANLSQVDDKSRAILIGSDLSEARLLGTNLSNADISDCRVYGASAWNVTLTGATQTNLLITPPGEAEITVDNLEMAQFLYLMLHNDKLRHIIDTITDKVILILGRFTPERKRVLDALRDKIRKRKYLPIVFDFEKPTSRDLTETISTLAHMAHFVIADLTAANSIPQELTIIIPNLPSVAIQPLIQAGKVEFPMFEHWRRYPWVLDVYQYESLDTLLATLSDRVITPAEAKAAELQRLRNLPVDGL